MPKLDLDGGAARHDAGPEMWPGVLDKLLVGVTHYISNRVATLAGVSDILAGDPSVPPILRTLKNEVPGLEEGIRLLRLLAAPENEAEEALEAYRLVDDAVALARLHPDARDVDYVVEDGRAAPPVLVRPVAFTHEVLIALTRAATAAGDGRVVTVRFSVVKPDLVVSADGHEVAALLLSMARGSA